MILTAFLPLKAAIPVMLVALAAAVIIPVVYSYSLYHKMKKNGEITNENISGMCSGTNKFGIIISIVITVALLAVLIVVSSTGNIDIVCGENSFEINADFWNDITVDYADIDEIRLLNDFEGGIRTYGFSSARLLMGTFENDEFGTYTRYTYGKCKTCIVIRDGENVLVINAENEEETKALYKEIILKR